MHIEQVDRHCDDFEQRLKNGEKLSATQFLQEQGLSVDHDLLTELCKLEREYEEGSAATEGMPAFPPREMDDATEPLQAADGEPVVSNYKLLQKIGEGGMGVVYMAEQTHPVSRRVALKVVKPGMDSHQILARFEAERQALALMDHPNMARVLDAGTTNKGLPYFVMELVKGIPITHYCDERQLSIRERLELFLPVCQAVQHAHQKGIIHRDIKPSNVLVAQYDNRPVPKIIDFGLAKAIGQKLTDKTMFTQYGQILGTIDYMSPEQASFNQLDVDTRSDIYSLGVLLYELLTGETPFDKQRLRTAAFDELLRIIRQEEPPRPSTRLSSHASLPGIAANRRSDPKKLSHLVRGELDWIAMKAMDKERDRRYQTAAGLADDVARYLAHQTVTACPPSAGYQLRKFARRNRALLASGAAVLTALVLGLAGTSWALIQTKEAQRRAEDELRLRERESNRQSFISRLQYAQARTSERFNDLASGMLDRITAELIPGRQAAGLEAPTSQQKVLDEIVRFWEQAIAADVDQSGNPGFRCDDYRVQLALCLARSGDHRRAVAELSLLKGDQKGAGRQAARLVRIYALCASSAESDPRLAASYIDEAVQVLKQAAHMPSTPPPPISDPELAVLAGHAEFEDLLTDWKLHWNRQVGRGE